MSDASSAPVAPGDVLAGKYRVERVLGVGGMGVVVAALHLELDERVAVKFLLPEISENTDAAARFIREARAAARIKSEHVARVIDVGRLENGAPYMVMEYLTGQDLSALLELGSVTIEEAADWLIQACHAMAEAHAAGIVHRDLKPANLFLAQRPDGTPVIKVLDFGISKLAGNEVNEASLTKTSTMMGSPLYMSPEQMRSARDVDHRTDIWALGTILFELLTRRPPFHGESLPELLTRIMLEPPVNLRELRPDVPEALQDVVLRCLQKSREARFQNVGELTRALLPFGSKRSRYTAERVLKLTGSEALPTSLAPQGEFSETVDVGEALGVKASVVGAQTATNWAETRGQSKSSDHKRKFIFAGAAVALGIGALTWINTRPEAAPGPGNSVGAAGITAAVSPSAEPRATAPAAVPVVEPSGPVVAPIAAVPTAAAIEAAADKPTEKARAAARTKPSPRKSESDKPRTTATTKPEAPPPAPAEDVPIKPPPKRNPLAIELK